MVVERNGFKIILTPCLDLAQDKIHSEKHCRSLKGNVEAAVTSIIDHLFQISYLPWLLSIQNTGLLPASLVPEFLNSCMIELPITLVHIWILIFLLFSLSPLTHAPLDLCPHKLVLGSDNELYPGRSLCQFWLGAFLWTKYLCPSSSHVKFLTPQIDAIGIALEHN